MASLQVALDLITLPDALALARRLEGIADIVEVGTPMIIEFGLDAVRQMRAALPETRLLADVKIMDAGFPEADSALRAGADIVTVLGVAGDQTVSQVVKAARQYDRRQVMTDLIECANIGERARQLVDLGVDIICVHTAADRGPAGEDDLLAELRAVLDTCPETPVAVAGGVSLTTAPAVATAGAAIVVVGSAVTGAPDPVQIASQLRQALKGD